MIITPGNNADNSGWIVAVIVLLVFIVLGFIFLPGIINPTPSTSTVVVPGSGGTTNTVYVPTPGNTTNNVTTSTTTVGNGVVNSTTTTTTTH
jgi:hypothetical protein